MKKSLFLLLVLLFCTEISVYAQTQYFGQNKPRNKKIEFKVLESPHFELYHYFESAEIPNELLIDSEHWYKLHQLVFKLAFVKPNPLIVYKNHPDFQETTAIGGQIGEGTGGVTEGLRNRVVMPMMYSKRQTDHVLGHELVHAFQYQTMTYGSDSTSLANIQNLPLFMVEGLAEYMSLGRNDSHTAMWMRDAVQSGDIPTIEELVTKQYKYFPYRWGQAFWAYVTAVYGDDIIRPLFKETAISGIKVAFQRIFKMDIDRFSVKFKQSLIDTYKPFIEGRDLEPVGKLLASEKDGGEMNISPAISPDGQKIAYISSKNVLSLDIYIADAQSGKILQRIASSSFGAHVDSYSFIETAGTWSPDSKKFAIVVQSKGKNELMIVDIANGRKKSFALKNVSSFTNPAWSPDGNTIAVSGLVEGNTDLYLFDLKSRQITNLTSDNYSDLQPEWSPDGKFIYFVSDRDSRHIRLEKANFSINRIDVVTKNVETFDLFFGADNLNPLIDPSGTQIYFLSDRDGFRNLYKYNLLTKSINQLSNFYTGISGITMFSPSISISRNTGEMAYSYFFDGNYSIVKVNENEFSQKEVENSVDKFGGILAPGSIAEGRDLVQNNLNREDLIIKSNPNSFKKKSYIPKFKLDYLANSGLGMSTSRFGTGMGGGITALFSDMLNNNQLSGTVALNGQIQDFGGQFYYLNQTRPLQFGASIAHIPYQFYDPGLNNNQLIKIDSIGTANGITNYTEKNSYNISRIFIDQVSAFALKPFSSTKRIEFGASMNRYSFNITEYPQYYSTLRNQNDQLVSYPQFIGSDRPRRLNIKDNPNYQPFNLNNLYVALVGDNATFGQTSPLNGYRYRIQAGRYFGQISYTEVLVDARKYIYLKPFTLAGRFEYQGRLNASNIDKLNYINPLYLGFPWNMHGFYGNAFFKQQYAGQITQTALTGDQMAVANFEIRLPFSGAKKLALIDFNFLPTDLNFFLDMGTVWSPEKKIGQYYTLEAIDSSTNQFKNDPFVTTGLSLRINLMGYLILEPYFALPFYNGQKQSTVSGINFMIPGW